MSYKSTTQDKNLAWILPRPKPDHYPGGMPLHCENWLLDLARDLLKKKEPKILNLFCGMNIQGFRVDLNPEVNPDIVCDAHVLTSYMRKKFDIILADPPYSTKESLDLYGTPALKYKTWTGECDRLLRVDGLLIVYHKLIMPNPNPKIYTIVKRVFIGNRFNRSLRIAIYFQKKAKSNLP